MTHLNKNGKDIFNGEPGKTLFTEPFWDLLKAKYELPELWKKTERAGDDRSLAIVSALIIENRIDRLLKTHMPGYKSLGEDTNFTFSLKIKLLDSLRLIPIHLTLCANAIRNIRNDFAHDLDKESFEDINVKYIQKMADLYLGIYGKSEASIKSTRDKFRGVAYIGIIGIDLYTRNVAILRNRVATEKFVAEMRDAAIEEVKQQFKDIEGAPETETIEGNIKVKRRGGVIVGLQAIMKK